MVHYLSLFAISLPLLSSVLAVPRLPRQINIPANAAKVAFDEDTKTFIAFDGTNKEIGKFPITAKTIGKRAGTCVPMNKDDIPKIPGIQKLRDEADRQFSKGKRKEVVNDPDLPDSPANICADDAGVQVVYDAQPKCNKVDNDSEGTLEGGTITLENNEGTNLKTSTTVTKSSSFGVGTKISASFNFPLIADVSTEISTTSDFTNTQGDAHDVGSDQRTVQRIEQPVEEGQNCKVTLTTNTCSVTGTGSLKMIATGMLWFEFEDKVDGHFKWGLPIEGVLPDVKDRSSAIEFKTTGNIDSSSHFASDGCTKK